MAPLRFRVWDKETLEMVCQGSDDLAMIGDQYQNVPMENDETVDQYVIMQSTGLHDKNGKEIYEGDVIKGLFDYGPAGFLKNKYPVTWDNKLGYQWEYWDLSTLEVIGNIFENESK